MASRDRSWSAEKSTLQPMKTRRPVPASSKHPQDEYGQFRSLVKSLSRKGHRRGRRRQAARRPAGEKLAEGTHRHLASAPRASLHRTRGPGHEGRVFVPPGCTLDAITGDRVAARRVSRRQAKPGQLDFTGRSSRCCRAHGAVRRQLSPPRRHRRHQARRRTLLIDDIPSRCRRQRRQPTTKGVFELLKYRDSTRWPGGHRRGPRPARRPGVDTLGHRPPVNLADEFPEPVLDAAGRHATLHRGRARPTPRPARLLTITSTPRTPATSTTPVSLQALGATSSARRAHRRRLVFVRTGEFADARPTRGAPASTCRRRSANAARDPLQWHVQPPGGQDRSSRAAFIDLDGGPRSSARRSPTPSSEQEAADYEQVNQVARRGPRRPRRPRRPPTAA